MFDIKAIGIEVLYIGFICQFLVQYVVFFSHEMYDFHMGFKYGVILV